MARIKFNPIADIMRKGNKITATFRDWKKVMDSAYNEAEYWDGHDSRELKRLLLQVEKMGIQLDKDLAGIKIP